MGTLKTDNANIPIDVGARHAVPLRKGLPAGWVWKTIGDVCDILSGYGFPKNLQGKSSGDLPFYQVGDISQAWLSGNRYIVKSNNYLSQEEAKKIKAEP
jgi:type I restriction enzyme S subunit